MLGAAAIADTAQEKNKDEPQMVADPQEDQSVPPQRTDEGNMPENLVLAARDARNLPLGLRMKAVSEPLLGSPYLVDAVGEGVAPDPDPPARYDAFDCLTFVEEVMALALAPDPVNAPRIRNALRYRNGVIDNQKVSYEDRNHFMLAEWVPRNIANGFLKDITSTLGETHLLQKELTAATWKRWKRRSLFHLSESRLPRGRFSLPVLSLSAAEDAMERIPDGAILLTVRKSYDSIPIVVTHLGFKIPSDAEPRMRHATKMGTEPRIRDERLPWYLEHLRWYRNWPIEGISVLMPQEFGPRKGRLSKNQRNGL